MVSAQSATPCSNLGFLSVFQESNGFLGGYLVTNAWGRPLEFRISTAVQPNKVQQILYGDTLDSYIAGEVIGKTLFEKSTTPVQLVVVDNRMCLDLRLRIECPVALWYGAATSAAGMPGLMVQPKVFCHAQFPQDIEGIRERLEKLANVDLIEPFARIREAVHEARKLGVTTRNLAA